MPVDRRGRKFKRGITRVTHLKIRLNTLAQGLEGVGCYQSPALIPPILPSIEPGPGTAVLQLGAALAW